MVPLFYYAKINKILIATKHFIKNYSDYAVEHNTKIYKELKVLFTLITHSFLQKKLVV